MAPDYRGEDSVRTRVTGLVFDCPYGESATECPLGDVRKKPLRDRIVEVLSMAPEDLRAVLLHHQECSLRRAMAGECERGRENCAQAAAGEER